MPESPEELYARVVRLVGRDGRLPMPPVAEWEMFPWDLVDGELLPKVLPPPVEAEAARIGEGDQACRRCSAPADEGVVWRNDRWVVSHRGQPSGMPLVLFLETREHLDFTDMDDDLAAEYGRITVRLSRIMSNLEHVGRVHVCRWGDGSAHLHVWFIARPARIPGLVGSMAVEWDAMLPPPPEDVWLADLHHVAERLARHDGTALR